jgi:hypothetical protein
MFLQVSRLVVDLMPFNRFWDVRIVRPYVTEPFVVAVLLGVLGVVFLPDRWRRYRPWVLIGAAEAVLVQSDIHSAMTLCMSAGMIAVWLLAVRREDRLSIAKRLLASTAAVSVLCVPFFIQRCVEHPGVPARVGAFPVTPRTALAFLVEMREPTHALGGLAALLGTAGLLWSLDSSGEATGRVRVMATLAGILVCSCLALPLSALVLGRTAQPDHFEMSRFVLTGYGLVVALTYLAQRLLDAVTARSSLGGAHAALAGIAGPGLMALLCLLGVKGFVISAHDSFCRMDRGHVRTDFQEYRSLRDYRQDFKALLSELERPAYADCRVLATFDHQAYAWWASFRRGHVFNPDPVNTSLCDAEIERRLVLFCRTLGMTPDQFVAFLERPYVNIFWLGGNKYQASRAYTFAPLDQYTEEQQAQIARTTLQCNWNVLVPEGEKRRLRDLYVNMPVEPAMPRLDAVILTNDESLAPFSPPEAEYKRTWQSRSLRVFVNRRLTR